MRRFPRRSRHKKSSPRDTALLDTGRRVGLARALSKLGYCSRAQATELIRAGRVRLNGAVRNNPETPASPGTDRIEVDGRAILPRDKIYLALNKPRGFVTTASDEKGRKTIYDLLRGDLLNNDFPWLAPVGRLDRASEGLLLLSNDSEWAARVTAPATHLEKTYHVQIAALANDALLAKFEKGIQSGEDFLRVKRANLLRHGGKNSWLVLILDEGRNRHIRRLCEALDLEVLRLIRVAIGPLALGDLAKGASRPLTSAEKSALDVAMRPETPIHTLP
ncbi:MAG: pseudouridine synthase [Candidatus Acidiferrales bacterium]